MFSNTISPSRIVAFPCLADPATTAMSAEKVTAVGCPAPPAPPASADNAKISRRPKNKERKERMQQVPHANAHVAHPCIERVGVTRGGCLKAALLETLEYAIPLLHSGLVSRGHPREKFSKVSALVCYIKPLYRALLRIFAPLTPP